jgi:hypothetical protein
MKISEYFLMIAIAASITELAGCSDNNTDKPKPNTAPTQQEYRFDLTATSIEPNHVQFHVKTNIPLPIEVMAGYELSGLKPTDSFIGYTKKIVLSQNPSTFVLDSEKDELPTGDYIAQVTFYPLWGANIGSDEAKAIKKKIQSSTPFKFIGVDRDAKIMLEDRNKLLWFADNISSSSPWNAEQFIENLGNYEELTVSNRNPAIIKAFYFESVRKTIFIYANSNKIAKWTDGKVTLF